MIGALTNHLWQSTVFAAAAALLTLAFRKNRAQVRYGLWLGASLKFLVPFSLLMGLGTRVWDLWAAGKAEAATAPAVSQAMVQIAEPFSGSLSFAPAAMHATNWILVGEFGALAAWACGFLGVALMRVRAWLRIRAALCASAPVETGIPTTMAVRSTPVLLEPGVVAATGAAVAGRHPAKLDAAAVGGRAGARAVPRPAARQPDCDVSHAGGGDFLVLSTGVVDWGEADGRTRARVR